MPKEFIPRPYQDIGRSHLLDVERCALWAGMGMGKTVTALTALDIQHLCGEDRPDLILAPLRVAKDVWAPEAMKWNHLRQVSVVPIVGTEIERRAALKMDASTYTCNYDNLVWLVEHFGDRWPFGTVIADESTKLKNFRLRQGGKRARALASVAHTKVKRFIELSGTPAPNGLKDLWGQMWMLDKGERLGRTHGAFLNRWFRIKRDGYGFEALPGAMEQIHERLKDLCLTIDAKDFFDLQAPIINNIYVDLPVKARLLYNEMEKKMFMELDSGEQIEAFNAAAKTMKLLQLSNGAVYTDDRQTWKEVHDVKLQALDEIVEEAAGAPVLVAYHFKSDLARLLKAFPQGRVLDTNSRTLTEWNKGNIPVLFAHPASAGHGLNLQDGGNIIVFFGHNWNLEERQQIIERIGPVRQLQAGHNRSVFIHNIIARDTVDELVMERMEGKAEVQELLLQLMKRNRP